MDRGGFETTLLGLSPALPLAIIDSIKWMKCVTVRWVRGIEVMVKVGIRITEGWLGTIRIHLKFTYVPYLSPVSSGDAFPLPPSDLTNPLAPSAPRISLCGSKMRVKNEERERGVRMCHIVMGVVVAEVLVVAIVVAVILVVIVCAQDLTL